MEILIIVFLILLNGVFAMSELALVSSRKFKLENQKKRGISGAKAALELSENPGKFLSTVQIGITLIGILLGVYSGENLTEDFALWLSDIGFVAPYANTLAVGGIVIMVTYFSIVLGELFPKRMGMTYPETIAALVSRPMIILSKITSPFVWLLTSSNDLLLRLFGIKNKSENAVSEEEIKSILRHSAQGGEIMNIEHDIVERVFELGDRRINSLFTHRNELIYFDIADDEKTIKNKISLEKHSAYPLCLNNDLDNIVGLVLVKDLFDKKLSANFDLRTIAHEPLYLNETMYAFQALELFKVKQLHYGIVVDEYGVTIGIITLDDIVDAIFGDTSEPGQEEFKIYQREDSTWLIDGQLPVHDFEKYFNTGTDFRNKSYTTLAGLILNMSQTIPEEGSYVDFEGFRLEIIDKDGPRIDKVLVRKI
ncbi:hemolysin family protein [Algoriphagus aquimarinus]|uniref:HlyC/CorC family transporter n=1 Tax=Algoriphagus aquimarinus TaxID=237018 RepID=A0A5C7AYF6_9BACT|nr:hemolysin family protein [Algoriphagus aquimarinus]TXE13708.1 HlyC/CorC family transporter [Algoriphagus aquimarinus]